MPIRNWSPAAEDALREIYGTAPSYELAQIFGTTQSAILHKAMRLGLSKKMKKITVPDEVKDRKRFLLRAKTLTHIKKELDEALG